MTEEKLVEIEERINGEHEPEPDWWLETVQSLIAEVRRLRASIGKARNPEPTAS